jgi:hypothetical protein
MGDQPSKEKVDLDGGTDPLLTKGGPSQPPSSSHKPDSPHEPDVVQFATSLYIVDESESTVTVEISRLGRCTDVARCRVQTVDGSAKSGQKYAPVVKTIEFAENESSVEVEIQIVQDDRWDPVLDFMVVLDEPENCHLGSFLYRTRVKILDDDKFPSNDLAEEIKGGPEGISKIPARQIIFAFLKFVFLSPGMRGATLGHFLIQQLHNLYLYLSLCLTVYQVDTVFNLHDPAAEGRLLLPDRYETSVVVAACFLVPYFALHFFDYLLLRLAVGPKVEDQLQRAIFRRYLNLSQEAAQGYNVAKIGVLVLKDAKVIVENGYLMALSISQTFLRLLIVVVFLVSHGNTIALLPLIFFPFGRVVWHGVEKFLHKGPSAPAAEHEVVHIVNDSADSLDVIVAYMQRERINNDFEKRVRDLHQAAAPAAKHGLHAKYVPQWCSALIVFGYTWYSSPMVRACVLSGRAVA